MSFDMTNLVDANSGAFDVLMNAVTSHLDNQYKAGRINGTDYANVYIQSIRSSIEQSISYTLQKQQVDAQVALTNAQKDQIIAETANTQEQLLEIQKRIELTTAQITLAQLEAQLMQIRIANTAKEGTKLDAEIALINQNVTNAALQANILVEQEKRAIAETSLINQKVKTEQASILDTVDGNTVAGTIGKQKGLYAAQTDGFSRDAEQKTAKIVGDIYQTLIANDPDIGAALPAELNAASYGSILNKLKAGIGI